ncbi:MAG: type II toxin-antitoxin system RelE/ParE family toxin [Leptospira sp.]|nr:type II toxin-antitoxin system RelE/ParE family toxin [Leptospira sp.]
MKYNVYSIPKFEKQAKKLIKKYPSLKKELFDLIESLKTSPQQGTPLANDCYKIRIAIASKGKGKSGGGRVITHLMVKEKSVYLLFLYDKSEVDSVSDKELEEILEEIQ